MAANKRVVIIFLAFLSLQLSNSSNLFGQNKHTTTYTNPIIHEDFSDPDAIRVGDYFYMTASSFTSVPGLPILQSKDLVHWQLIGYALKNLTPSNYYSNVQHGAGVWAPSIRYHDGEFYIYYPDPDFGIYMIKSKNIASGWSDPVLVLGGKGLIDPCPLWDDNGKVYLVHAFAGSRAGIKTVLAMKELNKEGTAVVDQGKLIYDGHELDPTVEGPKIYKRAGWYYVFAPAGGVATGWQIVLRSKNIYGPYERKKVMDQGSSSINGPHQGAWVQTKNGEDWFIHFQDKGAYGRITHLQPMVWKNDWPVIGLDTDGDGIGNPVTVYPVPNTQIETNTNTLEASPFQWNANPGAHWSYTLLNSERHYAVVQNDSVNSLWNFPALYLRKLPAEKFVATTSIHFNSLQVGERTGLIVFGKSYAAIELKNTTLGLVLNYVECNNADKGAKEIVTPIAAIATVNKDTKIFFRISMDLGAIASFAYSMDGVHYTTLEHTFKADAGVWVGAKMGFYCASNHITNDAGFMEIKSFNIQK